MATKNWPVVFIHGLWLHSSSWKNWEDYFEQKGYDARALDWPGDSKTIDEARKNPYKVANKGLQEIVNHHALQIAELDTKPIIIGHSFGGLIVEELMSIGAGVAGVAIDAAPIKGVKVLPFSALRVAFIALKNPLNKKRAVNLTPEEFRYGFGNAVSALESDELYEKWSIPSPGKPLFEAAAASLSFNSPAAADTKNPERGPLLLISGGMDHTVPSAITKSTLKLFKKSPAVTDIKIFDDRGHSLTIDSGWQEIADYSLDWLKKQGL